MISSLFDILKLKQSSAIMPSGLAIIRPALVPLALDDPSTQTIQELAGVVPEDSGSISTSFRSAYSIKKFAKA